MTRYCDRDICGHAEDQHLPEAQGGCFERNSTGHMCLCAGFVAAAARPPSVPPALRVVELPEHLQPLREIGSTELEAHARRTFDARRPSETERAQEHMLVDPGMKIYVSGKGRELTELHAAGNAIIAETNADDLAVGAHLMRQEIRKQANEIVKLRAELENRDRILDSLEKKPPPAISVSIKVEGDADPRVKMLAAELRKAAEEALASLQPKA